MNLNTILQDGQETLLLVRGSDLREFADSLLSNRPNPVNQGPEKPITQDEAVKLMGKSRQAFFNWRKKGLINAYTINGRIYYKESELLSAMQKV